MTHDELLAKFKDLKPESRVCNAIRAVVELPSELLIERTPDELTAIGQADESFMSGYKYAMHLVIQAIEEQLK